MATSQNSENNVKKIYLTVIEEVLTNVREAFLDEGYDEQLLQELKHLWETKLNASKALQPVESGSNGNSSSGGTATTGNSRNSKSSAAAAAAAAAEKAAASANNHLQEIKGEYDPTRSALNALPHSIFPERGNVKKMSQVDGGVDGSSSDDDEEDEDIGVLEPGVDDEDDEKANNEEHSEYEGKEDPDPLNSDDDLTDQSEPDNESDLFDTDHVIVCQYDKITRIKNRWKFHLKDGIMNINGRDYLFSKATGDAEW